MGAVYKCFNEGGFDLEALASKKSHFDLEAKNRGQFLGDQKVVFQAMKKMGVCIYHFYHSLMINMFTMDNSNQLYLLYKEYQHHQAIGHEAMSYETIEYYCWSSL